MADRTLDEAIEDLYVAFARYERPTWLVGCDCCWEGEPSDDRPGYVRVCPPGGTQPLREVCFEELEQLATDATGDDAGRLHYVPRILELLAADSFDEPAVVLDRLVDTPEKKAIGRFLDAWWDDVLTRAPGDDRAGQALEAIERIDPDAEPKLARWAAFPHPNAAGHLLDFLERRAVPLALGKLDARLAAWVRSEPLRSAVAVAADRARTPAEREALDELWLRWLT
ncbi:MAG TPA: hypothetical protein VHF47_07530 [Acidimicrobiales bacterium]|nr:hypothetical protein [Acidimicrobiales bacterium]